MVASFRKTEPPQPPSFESEEDEALRRAFREFTMAHEDELVEAFREACELDDKGLLKPLNWDELEAMRLAKRKSLPSSDSR